jgi:hypothetical protein
MRHIFVNFLQKKPNLSNGFKLMTDWDSVSSSTLDSKALELFKKGLNRNPLCKEILKEKSKEYLLSYLRYDFKKMIIRTRYLYVDKNFNIERRLLDDPPEGFGFFEPISIVFSFLEGLGGIRYPNDYLHKNRKYTILRKMIKRLGLGYRKYYKVFVDHHRNGLAHELRPRKKWVYDHNTEDKYLPPWKDNNGLIHIDIPHFIDSVVIELENVCDDLCSYRGEKIVRRYIQSTKKLIRKP